MAFVIVASRWFRPLQRGLWLKEIGPAFRSLRGGFLQRRDVYDPDAPPVRSGDQLAIARVNLEIVHRHRWQSRREAPPRRAAIHGDVDADRRSDEQEIPVVWILTHD